MGAERTVGPPPNITELLKNASKIVLLKVPLTKVGHHSLNSTLTQNMVTLSDVDDELEGEIREEMTKYGQLNSVVIHKVRELFCLIFARMPPPNSPAFAL